MAVIETWFKQDLQKAVQVKHFEGSLFSGNANGNRIGVIVTNNGAAASLSGTVSGYAVLADGTSVPCTGSLSGNRASVLLPAAAYKPGIVFISIFLTSGSTVTTLAAVSANVQQARTDSQVSPGSAVTDWTQTINAAMQSVVDANAANMAVEYGSLTYPVPLGKYTIYNDLLYRCTTPIATAESWTDSHWMRVRIADDVADLKSAINSHFEPINIISGFLGGDFSGSSLTIASRTNAVDLYFPVVSGKKYTIVKPTATSYWRVGYSSNVPAVGTTLTNYNSSVSASATHGTYTAPISGYLCAYVYDNSDSGNRDAFKNGLYAYEGEYNSNYDAYTAKLSNVINVPENTGETVNKINATGILDDYLTVPNTKVSGYSINSDSGNFNVLSDSSYVEIPVVPGIKISGYTRGGLDANHGYAFYDSDGVFILGGNNIGAGTYDWNYNVTTPSNASIFRITCVSAYINSFTANYSDVFGNTVKAVSSIQQTNVYYCGSNRTLNTLKKGIEEATKHMNAVLYVDPGTYDLVQEFSSAWFDALTSSNTMSGLVLKNRVHVIFAPNSKVVSNYTGNNEYAQKLYSPFNAGEYGFTLENLTLECSRCRYGIHDERNGAGEQYKSHYINCNVYIDNSNNDYWSNRACIGGGLGSNAEIIVQNCVWKTDDANERGGVYYHQSNNTSSADYKSFVCIKDCWFVTGCVQIDDARTGSTAGKTIYQVNGNSFLKKYSNTNEQGVYVANMTSPTSEVQAWNNVIRTT